MLKHSARSHVGVSHHSEAEHPRRSQDGCSSLRPNVRRSSHPFGDSDEARLKTTCSGVHSQGAPAFNKARLKTTRSEVHSSVHQRLIRRVTREKGLTRPDDASPKECERGRAEVLGTFSARARREDKKQRGVCDCGRHALRAGRQVSFANVTPRSAPFTKRT